MSSYCYLISSLPSLKADAPMPFSYNRFLDMCKNCVDASVYEILEGLDFNTDKGAFFRKWSSFYKALYARLNCLRSEKLGRPVLKNADKDSSVDAVAEAAMNADNPLEAEKILLKAEFDYLDSMVSMHYFDSTVLFGYALKMKLLERQNRFVQKEGKREFERLFTGVQQQIMSI